VILCISNALLSILEQNLIFQVIGNAVLTELTFRPIFVRVCWRPPQTAFFLAATAWHVTRDRTSNTPRLPSSRFFKHYKIMDDRHSLVWSASKNIPFLPDLPPHITRLYIPTLDGPLELLSAQPPTSSEPRKKAILFQHGGFGCASIWIPFLDFLSKNGYPCYAVSLRGHGGSWKPGYFRMVWMTGKATLAQDITSAIAFIGGYEYGKRASNTPFRPEDLVLVGHSAGGGLCQYFISKGLGNVGALVLIAAIPAFGG